MSIHLHDPLLISRMVWFQYFNQSVKFRRLLNNGIHQSSKIFAMTIVKLWPLLEWNSKFIDLFVVELTGQRSFQRYNVDLSKPHLVNLIGSHWMLCHYDVRIEGQGEQRWGVLSQIPPFRYFSDFSPSSNTHYSYWISLIYLTGVTAAQLRWHLSNMKLIQEI